jgi:hypothetical protein
VSAIADPFTSLRALIGGWSAGVPRREVLVVTDGADIFEDVEPGNESVDEAIKDAQPAGVQVFCFYAPGAGHLGHSSVLALLPFPTVLDMMATNIFWTRQLAMQFSAKVRM